MNVDVLLLQLAVTQFGLVTRQQLRDLGLSDRQIARRVAGGMLRRVQPGVFAVAGAEASYEQKVLAPVLAVNGLAAVSHRSAARILGLRGNNTYGAVDITVGRASGTHVSRARLHRSSIFDRHDVVVTRGGIPVTRPERTVVGAAALAPGAAGRFLDAAIHAGLTTYERMWTYLTRYSGPGCPGAAAVRDALMKRHPMERPPESTLEDAWLEKLEACGVTGLVTQYPVQTEDGEKRIDVAQPDHMAGVEFDSKIWHCSEEDYQADRRKRYLLAKAGFRIFPVTEFDLHERSEEVAADLLAEPGAGTAAA